MPSLLEKAKKATPPRRGYWTKYREVVRVLMEEQGFYLKAAVDWIAEEDDLTESEAEQFYASAKRWRGGSK